MLRFIAILSVASVVGLQQLTFDQGSPGPDGSATMRGPQPQLTVAGDSHAPAGLDGLVRASEDARWSVLMLARWDDWELEGAWYAESEGDLVWFRPEGDGPHSVRAVAADGSRIYDRSVAPQGEVLLCQESCFVDREGRGSFVVVDFLEAPGGGFDCTHIYNGVTDIDFGGSCWGTIYIDHSSGASKRVCDKQNETGCSAEILYGDPEQVAEPIWECITGQGRTKRWLYSHPNGTAIVNTAQSGC